MAIDYPPGMQPQSTNQSGPNYVPPTRAASPFYQSPQTATPGNPTQFSLAQLIASLPAGQRTGLTKPPGAPAAPEDVFGLNNDPFTPYDQFVSTNKGPGVDSQADAAAGSFLSSYQNKAPISSVPVGRVENQPAEYYQKQIEDLTKPLTAQYDKARAATRGDQAARGTIYDSQGYQDIGDLDKNYLETIGSITRGTEIERMKEQQANEQAYQSALLQEGQGKRAADLQGLGLDTNMINSLLGYGADRYKSSADLFKGIYGADTDLNKTRIETGNNEKTKLDTLLRLIEAQGYTGVPQEQLWEALSGSLGFDVNTLPPASQNTNAIGSDINEKISQGFQNGQYHMDKGIIVDQKGHPVKF